MTSRVRDDSWKPKANAAMESWADGDARAGEEVYDLLAPRLNAFLVRRTRAPELAADLTQETFLRMHRSRSHFARGTDVATWAFTIARRLSIDEHRKTRQPIENERSPPEPPDVLAGRQRLGGRILAELARLPEGQREAFELLHFEGLSTAEAATILGVTRVAIKLRVYKACRALRLKLGDEVRELLEVPT